MATPDLSKLQQDLEQAQGRLKEHCRVYNFKNPEWRATYNAFDSEILDLERRIAALKGEEYAIPLDFPEAWDVGAPSPHLLTSGHRTLLLFYRKVTDPNWDGTTVRVVDPASSEEASLVLVEFFRCQSAKLGSPNDEVFSGHPLEGRGLKAYSAQEVINSKWIEEVQSINSVHPQYRPENWTEVRHFVFWFHDDTFECLAHSFAIELHNKSMPDLLQHACSRLNG